MLVEKVWNPTEFIERCCQMNLPRYPLASGDQFLTFEFTSEGQKGLIHKIVRYQPTNLKNVYNLAFGDKVQMTGDIDDLVISNNGDMEISQIKNMEDF